MTLKTLIEFERKGWVRKFDRLNRWFKVGLAILGLAISVWFSYAGLFKEPRIAWLVLFGLLYASVGFGGRATVREWKEETLYWWLSIPAPREQLILAKFLAALEKWMRLYLGAFIFIAVYIYLVDLAGGLGTWSTWFAQMQAGFSEVVIAVTIGPFLLMAGMLLGSFRKSSSKFVVAFSWAVLITILNLQFTLIGLQFSTESNSLISLHLNYYILLAEAVGFYVLAYVIFKFMAYRLKAGKLLTGD